MADQLFQTTKGTLLRRQVLQSHGYYRSFMEDTNDAVDILDLDGRVLEVNRAFEEIYGWTKAGVIGNILPIVPPSYEIEFQQMREKVLAGEKIINFETVRQRKCGKEIVVSLTVSPVYNNKGQILALSAITRDMTERVEASRQLVESKLELERTNERLSSILENINEMFCIIPKDKQGVSYISPAYEKISGLSIEDLYANPIGYYEIIHPEDKERVVQYFGQFLEGPDEIEYRIIHKEYGVRWIHARKTIVRDAQQNPEKFIVVSKDITELKEKDILIRKGDKLGVVGQLAAGIAHEIRNPLTAIKGFVQLWGQETDGRYSEIILSELRRIEVIMNEFLMLAKPHQDMQIEPYDLNKLLKETIMLMSPEALLKNVDILSNSDNQLAEVLCEEKQIKQVIINLMKNAMEAMPSGGALTIRTRNLPNGMVSLLVSDEGIGISQDRIVRLGEPFFLNKEKGTGLGLMVSFKIIENHNGTIEFTSEEGKGTTVEVCLPVYKKASL